MPALISANTQLVAERAKALYSSTLQNILEIQHCDRYVAVEPDSGAYFLGDTFSDAVRAARSQYPDRLSFVIHIGHPAAIHLGAVSQ